MYTPKDGCYRQRIIEKVVSVVKNSYQCQSLLFTESQLICSVFSPTIGALGFGEVYIALSSLIREADR